MTNPPTGRLQAAAAGVELIVSRSFRAPIEDVWASVTESDRTARWFGAWEGDAAPGAIIKMQMAFEESAPWFDVRIEACEPPRRLLLVMTEGSGIQRIELRLAAAGEQTDLELVQHLDTTDAVGDMGPGWEYYLDNLVASRAGQPLPSFDDYYPAMKPYYEGLSA
ncbi:SRPBCC family protein [Actinoplanes sp. NPDC051859]|uniref:SRPBCC family protein n=1 Tax=Actinoplanes sp. NPDC051859 TaxID=3363909 RepID=UPI0037A24ADF